MKHKQDAIKVSEEIKSHITNECSDDLILWDGITTLKTMISVGTELSSQIK